MSKVDDMMQHRNDGMTYALKIAETKGIEELRNEISRRRLDGYSLNISREELQRTKQVITERTVDIVTALAALTLHDEFDFGQKRCTRFMERFRSKADCLFYDAPDGSNVTLEDYLQILRDEVGISIDINKGLGK